MAEVEPHSPRRNPAVGTMGVRDFWRYNLDDGRRERLAVAASGAQWSPDETRFLLHSSNPRTAVNSKPPLWSLVYSRRQWSPEAGLEAAWLADSRHTLIRSGRQFYVESVDQGEPIRQLHGAIVGSVGLRVDALNRVYLLLSGQQAVTQRPAEVETILAAYWQPAGS